MLSALLPGALSAAQLTVGDASITLPVRCDGKAVVSEVAESPLYTREDAAALASDPMLTLKPDYSNMPAHWRVDLSACLGSADQGFATELLILPVDAYLGIYAPDRKPEAGMRSAFAALKKWIAGKSIHAQWTFVPFVDMSPIAVIGTQRFGSAALPGARVLTQFTPDVGFLRNGALTYIYQGLTEDGRHYVLMTVPVHAPGLAQLDDTMHWGYTLEVLDAKPEQRKRYAAEAGAWFGKNSDNIEPALGELDAIAGSVVFKAP